MRIGALWLRGIVTRRAGRMLATAAGIAVAVALLASIGSFLGASQASMTSRTVSNVPVDWQVEAQQGADPSAVLTTVASQPGVVTALAFNLATTTGLSATTGGTTQTTGAGVVVGLSDQYRQTFPDEIRTLVGSADGVLVTQQTASNLHARPGDKVTIGRAGLSAGTVVITGVIDLPHADNLFQKVGAPVGSQPVAPPDNVVLLPLAVWHEQFDALASARPDQVHNQVHVRLDHRLPASPAAAFEQVSGAARNLETRLAGAGLVGNNLAAGLDAARSDAAYAAVMFLFLGLPGAVLAGLLTAVVAASGADRRRREYALLRARGATVGMLLRLAAVEAAVIGAIGTVVGLLVALAVGQFAFGCAGFGSDAGGTAVWTIAAALVGLGAAALVVVLPGWRDARRTTVAGARRTYRRDHVPAWARLVAGMLLLAVAVTVYAITGRQGYTLVLAPEGVTSIAVDYLAFLGPACLWLGAALLTWRAAEVLLGRGRPLLSRAARPLAAGLATTITASMARQRRLLAPAVVLVGMTAAFAASTAVFNATYAQQAEADARLTNGANVTVALSSATTSPPGLATQLAAVTGVSNVEPLVHRFAYVGNDLQDLYGVRATTVAAAGGLQDAYFQGASAATLMQRLAAQPDGILVSAETVKDFQLQLGDRLILRLQDQRTHALMPVNFHYVGIVKEFPTAPRDSFLLANANYVARSTGDAAPSIYLLDTSGQSPPAVAAAVRHVTGVGAQVTDIVSVRKFVGSSLTAVDLNGLTRVELGFAFVFLAGSTGLLLALGIVERRRTLVLAAALGARPRQLAAFLWSEAAFILVTGLAAGALAGWALSRMLVAVLTGVFDPPPAALAVPWGYLASGLAVAMIAVTAVVLIGTRALRRAPVAMIREL